MMTHPWFLELLIDAADRSLSPSQRSEFEAHRRQCTECSEMADAYFRTLEDLRAFPELEVSSGFTAKILERTSRQGPQMAWWETVWLWVRYPRLSPVGVMAALALPLLILAGTPEGRNISRGISMAAYQTYSEAVRLYYRSADLRMTASDMGRELPNRLGETVSWIRERLASEGAEDESPPSSEERDLQSHHILPRVPRA